MKYVCITPLRSLLTGGLHSIWTLVSAVTFGSCVTVKRETLPGAVINK